MNYRLVHASKGIAHILPETGRFALCGIGVRQSKHAHPPVALADLQSAQSAIDKDESPCANCADWVDRAIWLSIKSSRRKRARHRHAG